MQGNWKKKEIKKLGNQKKIGNNKKVENQEKKQ